MTDKHRRLTDLDRQQGRALYGMLYRLTLDTEAAADLLQELFLCLVRSVEFTDAADPVAYAYRVAMNLASNYRRARSRRLPMGKLLADPMTTEPTAMDKAIQEEEIHRLLATLDRIPVKLREAFVLRHLEQQPYETVGRTLGTSAHGARMLAHRAVRLLRDLLNEHCNRKEPHVPHHRT